MPRLNSVGVLTYAKADALLGKKDEKLIGNNTTLFRCEHFIGIVLHNTTIIHIFEDDTYGISTGGWKTVTTKDRINRYTPANVGSLNFHWKNNHGEWENKPFYEGAIVDSNGEPIYGAIR